MQVEDINKEEFDEWLSHPVTRAVLNSFKRNAEEIMLGLAQDAGISQPDDRYRVGRIHAFIEASNVTLEETNDSN